MRNYTSLEPVTITDIGDVFFPVSLTKEEFDAQKVNGTIYKGFVPPKDITMLKFRYYTPDNVLMEQNNVPVVYDGTAVVAIINYYKLSDENKGITFNKDTYQADGWVKTPLLVTPKVRFLWKVTETVYSNGARDFVEPYIDGVYGDKGEKGDRGEKYLGHYTNNQEAYEDNTPDLFFGDYYLNTEDKYLYEWSVDGNGAKVWKQLIDYSNSKYSIAIDDIFATIENIPDEFWDKKTLWVKNLVASKAFIDNLNTSQIVLKEKDVTKEESFIKSENFKEDGSDGFKISSDGSAIFNNIEIGNLSTFKGNVENQVLTAKQFDTYYRDVVIKKGDTITNIGDLFSYYSKSYEINGKPNYTDLNGVTQKFCSASIWTGSYIGDDNQIWYWATIKFNQWENGIYGAPQELKEIYSYISTTPITYPFDINFVVKENEKITTLKFHKVPTIRPSESNVVYVDENGFLKLS